MSYDRTRYITVQIDRQAHKLAKEFAVRLSTPIARVSLGGAIRAALEIATESPPDVIDEVPRPSV
jgi:hypothetical protein